MLNLENLVEKFVREIFECGAFKDKTQSPGREGFKIHLHQTDPQAPLSPFFIDLGILRSFPRGAKATAVDIFQEMIRGYACDILVDVPTGITPIVSSLSDRTEFPMVSPRAPKDERGVGTIDGVYRRGATAGVFEDVITTGAAVLRVAKILKHHALNPRYVFALVDREEGGRANLAARGLELRAALTISKLLKLGRDMGLISHEVYEEIADYRKKVRGQ